MIRKLNVKLVVAAIVIGLACCIAVTAYWDYVVISYVNNPYVASPQRTEWNNKYGAALNAEMLIFGIFGSVLIKIALPGRRIGTCFALTVLITSILFVVGNLEDWLYFFVGYFGFGQPLPAWNINWNWMPQATWAAPLFYPFGFNNSWTTLNQVVWSILWLFVVLPVGIVVIFKFPKR
jgi:hypothetical protein